MKKRKGHHCWLCGHSKPNEAFSGKGRRRHLCKQCSRLPREELEKIRAERDLLGFLYQKHISANNVARAKTLCEFHDPEIRQLARTILEVAAATPHRRKRAVYLHTHRPDLYSELVRLGVYREWAEDPEDDSVMKENDHPRYFNDDGTEFTPGLYPVPDLCVSCTHHETHDAGEEILCNLTREDQRDDAVFVCFAYRPMSPDVDRAEVLRELCRQAGDEYPEDCFDMDDDAHSLPF